MLTCSITSGEPGELPGKGAREATSYGGSASNTLNKAMYAEDVVDVAWVLCCRGEDQELMRGCKPGPCVPACRTSNCQTPKCWMSTFCYIASGFTQAAWEVEPAIISSSSSKLLGQGILTKAANIYRAVFWLEEYECFGWYLRAGSWCNCSRDGVMALR